MDRSHLKETLSACLFEICHLYHDRKNFHKVNQPDDRDKQRHLHHICRSYHESAKRQRTCIAHKDLGRIYIKQQKSKKRTRNGSSKRLDPSSEHEGSYGEKYGYHCRNSRCQTVQTVCKIYAVYSTDDRKICDRHRDNTHSISRKHNSA